MKDANKKRELANKRYQAYIPNYMASSFDEKLKENNLTFTQWLKISIEKFLKK